MRIHPLFGREYPDPYSAGDLEAAVVHGLQGKPALQRQSSAALSDAGKSGDPGTDREGDRGTLYGSAVPGERGASLCKMPRICGRVGVGRGSAVERGWIMYGSAVERGRITNGSAA